MSETPCATTTTATTPRGAFILFEGCDRCGKTTQANMIVDFLVAKNGPGSAVYLKFPDRTTEIGKMINSYLTNTLEMDDKCLHLLFSANRWEAVKNMRALLDQGITIVADRYAYSGVAFSAAKGLDMDWCKSPDIGLPQPDVTLFLALPVKDVMMRGGFGEERYEKEELQVKAKENFMSLVDASWRIIGANMPVDQLHEHLREVVLEVINKVKADQAPIKELWRKE